MARFLQLTDLHVMPARTLASGVLDTCAILTRAIDRLVEIRTALDPLDAVLVSGDISDDGSADSYQFARVQLERLGLPLFVVPGNHDARESFRTAFADLEAMPEDGLIDWAASVGDTRVIGLDTLVEGQSGGKLSKNSLDFLTEELTRPGSDSVVVLLHHPPIRTGIRFMDAIGLENTSDLAVILSNASFDVILLAGHVHGVHHGRIGRHTISTAPAICSGFAPDRRENAPFGFYSGPTGCAVIETGTDGIWSAVSLDPTNGPFPF